MRPAEIQPASLYHVLNISIQTDGRCDVRHGLRGHDGLRDPPCARHGLRVKDVILPAR